MKKSAEATVIWDDIEPATFVHLMEYVYTRDYSVPKLAKIPDNNETDQHKNAISDVENQDNDSENEDRYSENGSQEDDDKPDSLFEYLEYTVNKGAQYRFVKNRFLKSKKHQAQYATSYFKDTNDWLVDIKQYPRTGYTAVFMTHINLYILGDKYGITNLKDLCLNRFRLTLLYCVGDSEMQGALLVAIRAAYSNTGLKDPLRTLLVEYCIADMEWFTSNIDAKDLISEVPDFSADLLLSIPRSYWVELGS